VTEHWCTPEVVAAVLAHMNGDHADDCVTLCRALAGQPDATAARMSGLDPDGMDLVATGPAGDVAVRIPFGHRLGARAEVRAEVARLYHEAAERLGLPAREH
jgi:putative heme iron utilization protein